MSLFASAMPVIRSAAHAFRPPKRVSVSQGAKDSLKIAQPGGYSGPWSADETPYMVEPMDMLASRRHESLCFVGPARSGKTMALLDGWIARNVTCDPGDMLVIQMTQDKARDFSRTRIDRAIKHSPKLKEQMSLRGHDDNTYDKMFRHGMWLKIGWPSGPQMASSDYRYTGTTDYDRIPDDIDGEGSAYIQTLKRTQTYLSRGMAMFESSPGRDYTDTLWTPKTLHEGPPCTGIVGIYNLSDRRRWYWQCPDCRWYFEAAPGLKLFSTLPPERELMEDVKTANISSLAEKHARVVCPHCGSLIEQRLKPELNSLKTARWVADGQTVTPEREVIGESANSSIAGYWLGGVAATYQKWDSIIERYLQGLREYVTTGADNNLKGTINVDQGWPYLPRRLLADQEGGIEDRTEELPRYFVPDEARFLVATADVQGGVNGRFVCEVRAFGEHLESWLVDRFSITTTERNGQAAQVDPAGYPEDWDLLTAKLVQATYKTSSGKELRVYRTAVDTGGEAGTTPNAYAWFRRLRKQGLSGRVMLVKGADRSNDGKPVVRGNARSNEGKPMPDMPIWLVGTDYFKDLVAGSLRRKVPGPGYFHAPKWLHASYFDELRAEVRDAKGKWKKVRARNEALDLWVYALAVCEAIGFGPKGRLSWDNPPPWARRMDDGNSELITREERRAEQKATRQQPAGHDHDDWNFDRRE